MVAYDRRSGPCYAKSRLPAIYQHDPSIPMISLPSNAMRSATYQHNRNEADSLKMLLMLQQIQQAIQAVRGSAQADRHVSWFQGFILRFPTGNLWVREHKNKWNVVNINNLICSGPSLWAARVGAEIDVTKHVRKGNTCYPLIVN